MFEKLKPYITTIKGKKPKSTDLFEKDSLVYLTTEFLRGGVAKQYISAENIEERFVCNESDLLIIWDGSNSGDVFLASKGVLSSTMAKIEVNSTFNNKYLYYFLKSNFKILNSAVTGAAIPHLNRNILENLKIYKATSQEQNKIVGILDDAADMVRLRKECIQHTEDLTSAIFYEMFGDPANNPMNLKIGKTGDYIINTQYGTSDKANELKDGIPVLRMNNITYKGFMDYTNIKHISLAKNENEKYLLKKGDIIFNRTNSAELVGKTGIFDESYPCSFASYLIKIEINKQECLPEYIWGFLNSDYGKKYLRGLCKQAVSQANINAQELRTIPIPKPSLDDQTKFAGIVNDLKMYRQQQYEELEYAKNLFDSLLQKAFTGELTASDIGRE